MLTDAEEKEAREELARLRVQNRKYRALLVETLLHEETGFQSPYYRVSALARVDVGDPSFRYALVAEWVRRGRPRTTWRNYAALEKELREQGEEFK